MSERDTLPGSDPASRPVLLNPMAPMAVERAAESIRRGRVVAIPTDTVYGLAAALDQPAALDRLYAVKGRPTDKPLPVLLSSPGHVRDVSCGDDDRILALGVRFWPGPLTLVVSANPGLPPPVVGRDGEGKATVGVRIPDHPLAIELIDRCGGALAVTSANRSGEPPALTGAEVIAQLGGAVDVVLDDGRAPGGVASTVVAFDGAEPRILRDGAIPRGDIEAAWRELAADVG